MDRYGTALLPVFDAPVDGVGRFCGVAFNAYWSGRCKGFAGGRVSGWLGHFLGNVIGDAALADRLNVEANIVRTMARLWRLEDGQDMVEYSLLIAFIALAAVGLLSGVKTNITSIWTTTSSALSTVSPVSQRLSPGSTAR